MVIFTKESLDALKSKIDLVEALSPYIEFKRSGASFKALCPFHDEKTPSFMIQKGDTHYHCFGCGAHGDAIGDHWCAEDNRLATGVLDGLLDEITESPNVVVAWRAVGVRHCQRDHRLIKVLVAETYSPQHGARSSALNPPGCIFTAGNFLAATLHLSPWR